MFYYAKTVLKNTLKKIILFKKNYKIRILDEYVKSTGVEYKETEINDSKIAGNLSEQEYVSRLNDKAMLSENDFHFLEMKMKTDWEHIKKVMNRSDDIKDQWSKGSL